MRGVTITANVAFVTEDCVECGVATCHPELLEVVE